MEGVAVTANYVDVLGVGSIHSWWGEASHLTFDGRRQSQRSGT